MAFTIQLTPERLKELLKAAYADGFEDGAQWTTTSEGPATSEYAPDLEWPNSVTLDQADALIARVRAGGKP
jgi:hypothetical protein